METQETQGINWTDQQAWIVPFVTRVPWVLGRKNGLNCVSVILAVTKEIYSPTGH